MSEKKDLTNAELLAKQQQQFENFKKEESTKRKKRWLWGCGGCLGIFIILAIIMTSCTGAFVNKVDKEINKSDTVTKVDKESNNGNSESKKETKTTGDQTAALNKAKIYADTMHMSKKGILNQLTSEADKFSEKDAQYAVDHLKVDYKKNALKAAKNYQKQQNMSKDAILKQLTSEYGDKFTQEEAQYAVDNL